MFTNNNSSWRCDFCDKEFMGDVTHHIIFIREGNVSETMHFCNYDHVAKYFASKILED